MAFFDRFRPRDGKTHDEKEISRLIQGLAGRSDTASKEAAVALFGIGAPAVPQILRALEIDPGNRSRIAHALAAPGLTALPFLLEISVQAGSEIRDTLAGGVVAGLGKDGGDALKAAIKHNRVSIRQGAAIALRGMGKKAAPFLAEALHDRDPVVQGSLPFYP
jgi:HEAT repeat protein